MQLQTETEPQLNDVEATAQDITDLNITHIVPSDTTCIGLISQVRIKEEECQFCGRSICGFFTDSRQILRELLFLNDMHALHTHTHARTHTHTRARARFNSRQSGKCTRALHEFSAAGVLLAHSLDVVAQRKICGQPTYMRKPNFNPWTLAHLHRLATQGNLCAFCRVESSVSCTT